MKYDNEKLQSIIGKRISSIVFHYWSDGNIKNLDWITFTIDETNLTYTCGRAAEDIVLLFDYSLPEIYEGLKRTYGYNNNITVISENFDCSQIYDSKLNRVLLIERFNFEYAYAGYFFFDNGKVIALRGGTDCVNIEVQNSFIESN